jgi:hypothetical protein
LQNKDFGAHKSSMTAVPLRNPNYLLLTFLILLGAAILVRTVAIAQHAYNLLLQPPIRLEAPSHFIATVANPDPSHASEVMVSHPVEKLNLIEHHFKEAVAESAPQADSPPKHQRPPHIASQSLRKKVALRRDHRFERNGFTLHRPWTMWW